MLLKRSGEKRTGTPAVELDAAIGGVSRGGIIGRFRPVQGSGEALSDPSQSRRGWLRERIWPRWRLGRQWIELRRWLAIGG